MLKTVSYGLVETFVRFQAGSCPLKTFIVFYAFYFIDFHSFSVISIDSHRFWISGYALLPLQQPLLDSRLASCPLRTFKDFHRFVWISGHGCLSWCDRTCCPYRPLLDSRLASCPLRTFIVFHNRFL